MWHRAWHPRAGLCGSSSASLPPLPPPLQAHGTRRHPGGPAARDGAGGAAAGALHVPRRLPLQHQPKQCRVAFNSNIPSPHTLCIAMSVHAARAECPQSLPPSVSACSFRPAPPPRRRAAAWPSAGTRSGSAPSRRGWWCLTAAATAWGPASLVSPAALPAAPAALVGLRCCWRASIAFSTSPWPAHPFCLCGVLLPAEPAACRPGPDLSPQARQRRCRRRRRSSLTTWRRWRPRRRWRRPWRRSRRSTRWS